MTSPDSLADRLEKVIDEARAHQPNALITLGMLVHDNRRELLATLRSASAQEVETIERVACLRCGGSGVLYWKDPNAPSGIAAGHCHDCKGTGRVAPPSSPTTLAEPEAEGA
jgi:Fe-S oxidoreductase